MLIILWNPSKQGATGSTGTGRTTCDRKSERYDDTTCKDPHNSSKAIHCKTKQTRAESDSERKQFSFAVRSVLTNIGPNLAAEGSEYG